MCEKGDKLTSEVADGVVLNDGTVHLLRENAAAHFKPQSPILNDTVADTRPSVLGIHVRFNTARRWTKPCTARAEVVEVRTGERDVVTSGTEPDAVAAHAANGYSFESHVHRRCHTHRGRG